MSPSGPGCVKTRLSQGRAELFSQLPSPNRSCQCNRFFTTTKSRQKFYAQVQRRSFHTAWAKMRNTRNEQMFSALPSNSDIGHLGHFLPLAVTAATVTRRLRSLAHRVGGVWRRRRDPPLLGQ